MQVVPQPVNKGFPGWTKEKGDKNVVPLLWSEESSERTQGTRGKSRGILVKNRAMLKTGL